MEEPRNVVSADELERLPLAERHVRQPMVSDLSEVDPDFLERARHRARKLLEERGIELPPS